MWLTPHTFAGVAIASNINNPILAIVLSFFSHFLLDLIPHWTTSISKRGRDLYVFLFDFALGLGVGLFFAFRTGSFTDRFWLIIACCAAANLPDAMRAPYYFFDRQKGFFEIWEKIHLWIDQDVENNTPFHKMRILGIATQIAVILLCLWLSW